MTRVPSIIAADPAQAIRDAFTGQIVVRCLNHPADDLTYTWPEDFDVAVTPNTGSGQTATITLDSPLYNPEQQPTWYRRASLEWTVTLYPVELCGYADGPAREGNAAYAAFHLGPVGGHVLETPFTALYQLGGEAAYGARYTFLAGEGLSFTEPDERGLMEITFAAQTGGCNLYVVPVDDEIPQWTERITLAVADADVRVYTGYANPAVMELVDDDAVDIEIAGILDDDELNPGADLIVNDDDNNGNGVADWQEMGFVDGENDLFEIVIRCPDTAV